MMDRARFESIVAAYGAEPRRWPEAERAAAEAFSHTSAGVEALREAQALDALLDTAADTAPVSVSVRARALAAAPKATGLSWQVAAALAACAVFGVILGAGSARVIGDQRAADAAFVLLLESGDLG